MSVDQTLKRDAGKARMELLPWDAMPTTADDYSVGLVFAATKAWWARDAESFIMRIPERVLVGVAQVLAFGAAKYSARGWEKGIPFSRVFAALTRHAAAVRRGDLVDDESGLPHEFHFWCNVVFLVAFTMRGRTDLDDRPPAQTKKTQDITVSPGSQESN